MSDVQLVWPNKHMALMASGEDGYQWVERTLSAADVGLRIELLSSSKPLAAGSNIIAIGDGLDVLEALKQRTPVMKKGVRLVYIDPPYNTGADVRQYSDKMDRPMWLSMMRDRLVAVRSTLAEDASVWVHLDDAEVHRARAILDEVFGEKAFVASVVWQKRTTRDSRAAFSTNHDTILVYAPSGPRVWKSSRNLLTQSAEGLLNRDNDPRGPWADAPFTAPGFRRAQQYDIVTPTGRVLQPPRGRSWYATEPTFKSLLKDDRIWFPRNGAGSPRLKLFSEQLRGLVPFTVWTSSDTGSNDDAKRHLLTLFPHEPVFDTPKPEQLLERIIHIASNPGDLVVDIFGGSGTTAAVAHKMKRQWVVAERNLQTVADFLIPRMQSVVGGADPGGITENASWKGGGSFRVIHVPPRFGPRTPARKLKAVEKILSDASTEARRLETC